MFCKIILLCCIINVIVAGVPKPDKIKNCRAIGGRCIKSAKCPEQDVLRTACSRGRSDGSRVCCAGGKQKPGNVGKKRNFKGCRQKHRCRKSGGRCIPVGQACQGRVKDGACKKDICQCCILKGGDRTETKLRGGKKKKNPSKGNKKDGGCKKKNKCKGFCVGKNEECLGDRNKKGCKGKGCSCCTLGNKKGEKGKKESSSAVQDYEEYDYSTYGHHGIYDYYYEDTCFGKNINGSCEDQGCFICGDDQCLPSYWKCNRRKECEDGSDELGCTPPPKYAPGSCPREYAWVLHSCYRIMARPSSWPDARMVCQAVNGDLALIYDHTLFTAYMKAFQDIDQAVYWLGVHRENGTYTWVNGTLLPENSSLWGSTENPVTGNNGEDCVLMNFSENRLQPTSCEVDTYNNKSIYSICEYVDNQYYGDYYY